MTFQEFLKTANNIADYKIVDSDNTRRLYNLWNLSEVTNKTEMPFSIEWKVEEVLRTHGYV